MKGRIRIITRSACLFVIALLSATRGESDRSPKPGDVLGELDQSHWQNGEGLLPPEILEHYKRGEYSNPIVYWPESLHESDEIFRRGTEENRGKFGVTAEGSIVEQATGRQPSYIVGHPFPDIDPADPQAAVKILWNHYYQYWYTGNTRAFATVQWLNAHGLDRQVVQDVYYIYYDAQPRELAPADNPDNLLLQFLANTVEPADVYGTTALSWRFRAAGKRDLMWAYVPALRRARQVSASNRSDGFLGSDMSQDDGPFFDGKPEDFTWKLVGEREALRWVDAFISTAIRFEKLPEGGWHVHWSQIPRAGYEVSGWKGLAWAPMKEGLAQRKMWVIEGTPRDRYYLNGRIELWIEKGNFEGAWNRKFDWKGELSNIYAISRSVSISPDGRTRFMAPGLVSLAENVRTGRATMAGPLLNGDYPYEYRLKLSPDFFDYQNLFRLGK